MEYWHSLPYSIYCLVMARYCPLPGQLCAIARHKTIRREIKFSWTICKKTTLAFTLHSSPNRLKPRYTLGLREVKSGAQLFTTLHHSSPSDCALNWNGSSPCSVGGLKPLFYVPQISQIYTDFPVSGSGWRVVKSGVNSSPVQVSKLQMFMSFRWRVKSVFESGVLFRRIANPRNNLHPFVCFSFYKPRSQNLGQRTHLMIPDFQSSNHSP